MSDFHIAPMPIEIRGAGRGLIRLTADEVRSALRRVAAKTEQCGDCWWWTGYTVNGYGSLSIRNSNVYLHVLSCVVAHGQLPPGHEVCHTCDNRPCWNPSHLFAGTHLENVQDMWRKGRGVKPPRVCGERHHLATLTDDQVAQIKATVGVKQRDIARAFGCSQSTVWRLLHGKVRA